MVRLSDERLCWLAVREHCQRRARKLGPFGWLAVFSAGSVAGRSTARLGGDARRDDSSDKLGDYGFACEDAARLLKPAEREHLRATGEVPDWFLAEVERRYAEIRKSG
jgi:hypothetical protein